MLQAFTGEFKNEHLSDQEKKERGILGRLKGVMADFRDPTRNGRLYSEELWEKVFSSPIMREKIQKKSCFGELGHPEDRTEVLPEKIALRLVDYPQKDKDGHLVGLFDILDTPNGRILMTLVKSGTKIGISSRGEGDVITDPDGTERVDPNTYVCECWDAVIVPSVEEARLELVESLDNQKITRERALEADLNQASNIEREIMKESLNLLNIKINPSDVVVDNKTKDDMESSLKKLIRENRDLRREIERLHESLSVCNSKECDYRKSIALANAEKAKLSESLKKFESQVDNLSYDIDRRDRIIESQRSKLSQYEDIERESKSLRESYDESSSELSTLKEKMIRDKDSYEKTIKMLESKVREAEQDSIIVSKKNAEKLQEAISESSYYENLSKKIMNEYIDLKAQMTGVDSREITKRLGKTFSFNEIEKICEDLKKTKRQLNSLPFSTSNVRSVKYIESTNPSNQAFKKYDADDISDEFVQGFAQRRLGGM